MLYVVGASLPKTDFLTKIDVVIVMTTISLAFTGLASLGIAHIHVEVGEDVARDWNWGMEISLIAVYVLANIWIFMPPCFKQMRGARRMDSYKRLQNMDIEASDAETGGDLPPTVEPSSDYYTLQALEYSTGGAWCFDMKTK
jgi:hypothetical protein